MAQPHRVEVTVFNKIEGISTTKLYALQKGPLLDEALALVSRIEAQVAGTEVSTGVLPA